MIGKRIRELRTERKLSQQALADAIGVSQKAIDYWERGINEPKAGYIALLCEFSSRKNGRIKKHGGAVFLQKI